MTDNSAKSDAGSWLAEEWTSRLGNAIEMMTEARPELMRGPPVAAGAEEIVAGMLWYSTPLDLAAGAAVLIGATEENWLEIGKSALLSAGVTESAKADARDTYLEIIGQATSGLAQGIAARLGKPVASLPSTEVALREADVTNLVPIEISLREPPLRKIYVGFSRALEVEIAPSNARTRERPDAVKSQALVVKDAAGKPRTLDLLLEVELPVSVSFGRAELPLRDVLKLISGSIVELNRTITDPVEIIVNNCVIARGEVVVVEGNYGVRIQQVVSREERLRTLK